MGRGCDVYRFDFRRQRERRVPVASRSRFSEYLPTVWRGRIAFARSSNRPREVLRPGALYTGRVSGDGGARRMRGGSDRSPLGGPGETQGPGPTFLDLRGSRLTFAWAVSLGPCDGRTVDREQRFAPILSELWSIPAGSGERMLVDQICGPASATFLSPTFSGRDIVYGVRRFDTNDPAERFNIRRHRSADGTYARATQGLPALTALSSGDTSRVVVVTPADAAGGGAVLSRRRLDYAPIATPEKEFEPGPQVGPQGSD